MARTTNITAMTMITISEYLQYHLNNRIQQMKVIVTQELANMHVVNFLIFFISWKQLSGN